MDPATIEPRLPAPHLLIRSVPDTEWKYAEMASKDGNTSERPAAEPEIIPPDRSRGRGREGFGHESVEKEGFGGRMPGGIFFDLRNGQGSLNISRIGKFKLALWLAVIFAIAIALVLTFASLFVIVAIVTACAAALATAIAWVKGRFGGRL